MCRMNEICLLSTVVDNGESIIGHHLEQNWGAGSGDVMSTHAMKWVMLANGAGIHPVSSLTDHCQEGDDHGIEEDSHDRVHPALLHPCEIHCLILVCLMSLCFEYCWLILVLVDVIVSWYCCHPRRLSVAIADVYTFLTAEWLTDPTETLPPQSQITTLPTNNAPTQQHQQKIPINNYLTAKRSTNNLNKQQSLPTQISANDIVKHQYQPVTIATNTNSTWPINNLNQQSTQWMAMPTDNTFSHQ